MAAQVPPLPYEVFFLYVEPMVTLVGAYYAFFLPETYLQLTQSSRFAGILALPTATLVAMRGLGNMYLAFALSEALVLRTTYEPKVWRMFLLVLLIADFGHLYSCLPLGLDVYYDVAKWNAIDWGNIGFVYVGATMRICFLAGIGMGGPKKGKAKAKKAVRSVADATPETPISPTAMDKTPAQSTRRRKNKSRSELTQQASRLEERRSGVASDAKLGVYLRIRSVWTYRSALHCRERGVKVLVHKARERNGVAGSGGSSKKERQGEKVKRNAAKQKDEPDSTKCALL